MDSEDTSAADAPQSAFPQTLWTVVLAASKDDPAAAARAITKLCEMYHKPILSWLLRHGYRHQDAEDFTQQFMLYLLGQNRFGGFIRTQVKFRSFLLECLKRFLRDAWKKQVAAKRGGDVEHLHDVETGVAASLDADRALDREFALQVHRTTMTKLEARFSAGGGSERFSELSRYLFGNDSTVPYAEVGTRLGLKPNAVKKAVFDLREEYCDRFRDEVLHTVSRETVGEEMRYLLTLLADADDLMTSEPDTR